MYRLEPNSFDVQCISLRFDSPSEVWLELTLGSGVFDLPVGMDGVPRFSKSEPAGFRIGLLGEWTEPNIFEIAYDEVGGPNHYRIRNDFADSPESVELEFSDPGGYWQPQTVRAVSVGACN